MNRIGQILMALLLLLGQMSVLEPAVSSTPPSSDAVHATLPCHSESRSHKAPLPHMCCSASLAFTATAETRLPSRAKIAAVEPAHCVTPLSGMALPPRTPPPRA